MSIGLLAYTILPVSLLISGWAICSVRRFPSRRRKATSVAHGAGAGGHDNHRVHALLRRRTAVHHPLAVPAWRRVLHQPVAAQLCSASPLSEPRIPTGLRRFAERLQGFPSAEADLQKYRRSALFSFPPGEPGHRCSGLTTPRSRLANQPGTRACLPGTQVVAVG